MRTHCPLGGGAGRSEHRLSNVSGARRTKTTVPQDWASLTMSHAKKEMDIFERLDVYIGSVHDRAQLLQSTRSIFYRLDDDMIVKILSTLARKSLLVFLIATGSCRRYAVPIRVYLQGVLRSEIAPINGSGFGSYQEMSTTLIVGPCLYNLYGNGWVSITEDYQNLRKLVLMLKARGLWQGYSRTVDSWRKALIDAL